MSALRDIPFQELLNQTAEHCGLDSERLGMSEGRALATFLTTAAREMLRENDWPGAIITERRAIDGATLFAARATSYARGAVVYTQIDGVRAYYECILPIADVAGVMEPDVIGDTQTSGSSTQFTFTTASIERTPKVGEIIYNDAQDAATVTDVYESALLTVVVTATALTVSSGEAMTVSPSPSEYEDYWEEYTGVLRIGYEQSGTTPMLDVLAVYDEDPTITENPTPCSYTLDATGIVLDPGADPDVWVQFRKAPPRFTVSLYSNSTAYAVGDLVVSWPHAYRCIQAGTNKTPSSEPTYWQEQTLPEKVAESVALHASEKWLRSNGQHAQANAVRSEREDALDRASRVRNRQEGQTRTYNVATRYNIPSNNYRPRRAAL